MKIRIKDCQREFLSLTKAFSVSSTCLGSMRNLVGKYTYYYLLDGKKNIMKEPGANDLWLGRSYMGVFNEVLDKTGYIYSGEICYDQPGDISSDINQNATHALDILVAANELRLCKLINCTQIYLIEKQSSWLQQNLTGILQLSCRHESFVKLRDYILEIVCKNPNALFESDDFLRLDETTLIYILKRDDLDMPEVKIWEYIIKWGISRTNPDLERHSDWSDKDFSTLERSLHSLIPLVRFFQMSREDYYQKVRHLYRKILPDQLNEDIIRYHMDSGCELQSCVLPLRVSASPFDSKIISAKDAAQIASWIDYKDGNPYTFRKNPYKFKLILRGSRDGFDIDSFHQICDNKERTVIAIKVSGTGEVVGGYNPLQWKATGVRWLENDPNSVRIYPYHGRGGYCESKYYNHKRRTNDSFLFSFGNNQAPKLSRILRESANKAISWDAKSGPCFGDADLRMTGQSTNTSNWVSKTQFYEHSIANLETFSAEEFEVFQIEHCTIFRLPKFFEFPQLNDLSPSQISHLLEDCPACHILFMLSGIPGYPILNSSSINFELFEEIEEIHNYTLALVYLCLYLDLLTASKIEAKNFF
ncbi:hypothetical protein RhiirA4_414896 [Rhizophagus irregularis]|uniref:TLDc domain-containing protein n=1 Tax=Rhizophagus irregularis TaxID=588596 RepID=A0A2I1FY67_9GLOM|nr:hypothetical protein RhiirA4_414896 [Rhizophagus irregularis]